MIEDAERLYREGESAARQGHYAEAALIYARIRHSCEGLRDHSGAFKAGVWEIEALRWIGRYHQAMSLLLTLLADPPMDVPEHERWVAQKKVFDILLVTRPELARLRRSLDDVSALAKQMPHPAGDLPLMEGELDQYQGKWAGALQHFEQAWSSYDNSGYYHHGSARAAAQMSLRLHRVPDAVAWKNHLALTEQAELASARLDLQQINSHLALYGLNRAALSECREAGCGFNDLEARIHLALRSDSSQQHDDPRDPFHPARALLRKRPIDPNNVHDQYDYRLTVVDYHLSSLRYAAGLPAIDDYYYQHPDVIPSRLDTSNPQDFTRRLRSFDKAWCRLDRHARWLDGLFQCDYRTKEAESRRERRDAIARTMT